ncbi:MAG: iron ABC transporter permease [Clostridia bacterium]|nr:iron ABC transporter permease [Clostridia bacterium]
MADNALIHASDGYKKYIRHKKLVILCVIALCIVTALFSLCSGSSGLSLSEVIKCLIGQGDKMSNSIVLKIRLPRIMTAILAGILLALSGSVMQSVLRNPLASASTLGVSQGASFGATIGIICFGAGIQGTVSSASAITIYNPTVVVICAFVGGIIPAVIILLLSRYKTMKPSSMVLVGVALSSLFNGGTTLVQYFADDVQVSAVVFWTFGDLGRTNWNEIGILAITAVIMAVFFIINRWNYNAMESGMETAKSLGVNVDSVMVISMLAASFAASVAVAFVGIISFVGLIAPHMIRRFVGNDYRYLLPASAFMGALLLLISDTFGRLIVAPVILPIGAITSFLGAPIFLYLLFKGVGTK